MSKLAICIPTFNRCEVIKDTFGYQLDICRKLKIDIYLYDSSSDGKTAEYAKTLEAYENLYYIPIDSITTLDEKVVMLFQTYGRKKRYDYFWLAGDGVSFSEGLLYRVLTTLQEEPTVVVINNEEAMPVDDKKYDNAQEAFKELFWKTILWGGVIIREDIYAGVDWNIYKKLFVGTDQISVGLHWYRLATLSEFHGVLLHGQRGIDIRKSTVKKLAWWKEKDCGSETTYRVWAKGLSSVAGSLPFEETVIRQVLLDCKQHMQIFSWLSLCRSRKDRVYNLAIYRKYREGIQLMSGHSYIGLFVVAVTPVLLMKIYVRIRDIFGNKLKERIA